MQADGSPDRLLELSPKVRRFLAGMRDEEVETLEVVVKQDPKRLEALLEFASDLRTFGRFTKWVIVTVVGIFISTVLLYEQVMKAIGFFRPGGPSQ